MIRMGKSGAVRGLYLRVAARCLNVVEQWHLCRGCFVRKVSEEVGKVIGHNSPSTDPSVMDCDQLHTEHIEHLGSFISSIVREDFGLYTRV